MKSRVIFLASKLKYNNWLLSLITACIILAFGTSMVRLRSNFYWNIGNIYWIRASKLVDHPSFFEGASFFWSQALEGASDQAKILLYLGSAYEQAGKPEEAIAAWSKLAQPVITLSAKGQTWLDLKAPHLALPWFRGITLIKPLLSDGWYYSAQAYIQSGEADKALTSLAQALKVTPSGKFGKSQIYFLLGYTYQYVEQPAQLPEAIHAYQKALSVQDFSDPQQVAEVHFRLCDALWSSGADPAHYANECRQAIILDPKHLLARFLLGIANYNQKHDVALAEQEFQIAQNIEPSPWGLVMLAYYIYEPAGLKEKARATYQLVLQRWPTFDLAKQRLDELD